MDDMNLAKKLINEFTYEEYGDESADYSDLTDVGLAYTTTEDGLHEIQASVDLLRYSMKVTVDDIPVKITRYDRIEDLIEKELKHLDFSELVYLSDKELAKISPPEIEPKDATAAPDQPKPKEPEKDI